MPEHHPNQDQCLPKEKKKAKEEEAKTKNENKVFDEEKRLNDLEFWNIVDREATRSFITTLLNFHKHQARLALRLHCLRYL